MKTLKIVAPVLVLFVFFACGGEPEITPVDRPVQTEEVFEPIPEEKIYPPLDTVYTTLTDSLGYFEIDLPANMEVKRDLNPDASLTYSYIAEIDKEVKELYVIVLLETKEDIESYDLDMKLDALSYSETCVATLVEALETYEVLSGEPKVEKINKMKAVITEMTGSYGKVNVFYKLAIFEGKNAFYQVLTWTILDQKDEFNAPMTKIVNSFREK